MPTDLQTVASLTLGSMLKKCADETPQKTALVDGERRLTYAELNQMAENLAAGLNQLGFKKGDRVAIYMKSSIEFVAAFYAIEKLGLIVAWVNPMYRKNESEFILKNSGAKGVVIFEEWEGYDYLESILNIRNHLPELEHIVVVGDGEGADVHRYQEVMESGKFAPPFRPPSIDTMTDLAMLIYTSGTTGNPKGAMITHYQALRAGYQYSLGVHATEEDIFIGVLPMSHSYGCGAILIQPFLLQATLVLMESFKPEKAFELIENEKITLQHAAPAHYILELNHKNRFKYDLSSLRAGLIAGQPAPEGLIGRVEKEMGVYLTSFWGASEVGPGLGILCPYPSPLEIREKYIGLPIEGTEVKVVDPATREPLPNGEVGELTVSGWHVLKGYWNNAAETRKQVKEGWLFTGDLVSKDTSGYISIYGRIKDLINKGGYKITPFELESLIVEHPSVKEVSVVATPNPVLGESICACVILFEKKDLSLDELKTFLSGKVSPHKFPDELCIMQEFPRLSGGVKLKKFGKGGIADLAVLDKTREGYRG
jgi:acyl-CoA synthetase (AMP-forming)/AMP-acid ligase II